MTRWLRAAREGIEALTKPTELTEHPPILPNTEVLSVKSVLSIGGEINTEIVDAWEERAAIREFDGGQSRKDAECDAASDIGLQQADLDLLQKRDKKGSKISRYRIYLYITYSYKNYVAERQSALVFI